MQLVYIRQRPFKIYMYNQTYTREHTCNGKYNKSIIKLKFVVILGVLKASLQQEIEMFHVFVVFNDLSES